MCACYDDINRYHKDYNGNWSKIANYIPDIQMQGTIQREIFPSAKNDKYITGHFLVPGKGENREHFF